MTDYDRPHTALDHPAGEECAHAFKTLQLSPDTVTALRKVVGEALTHVRKRNLDQDNEAFRVYVRCIAMILGADYHGGYDRARYEAWRDAFQRTRVVLLSEATTDGPAWWVETATRRAIERLTVLVTS